MAVRSVILPDGDKAKTLIAQAIAATPNSPSAVDLATAIQDITLQTQILGASMLKIPVIDPDWDLQMHRCFWPDEDGLLPAVDIEYPAGSGWWWRMCMENGSLDRTTANFTITFQDRIISYLRDHWGPLVASPKTTTRAQFVKRLVDEVGRGSFAGSEQPIKFICPSINQLQPIASSDTTGVNQVALQAAVGKGGATKASNKLAGITDPNVLTEQQQTFVGQLALKTGMDPAVLAAWCLAEESSAAAIARVAAGDNNWLNIGQFDSGPGAIAFDTAFKSPVTAANQTAAFLQGTWGGASSSIRAIISTAQQSPAVQIGAIWHSDWASSHYNNGANLRATYKTITGVAPAGTVTPGGSAANPTSDVRQLTRGTTDNTDEDSWDCIQRLAQQVGWFAFSVGGALYFMSGEDMVAQPPAAYIDRLKDRSRITALAYTYDNTAFTYQSTHKKKGKIQKRSRIAKPQTPSQVTMSLSCGITDFHAGSSLVFQTFGPITGRWIVTDITRNCLTDTFSQFTIQPPTAPFPEPALSASGINPTGTPGTGDPSNKGGNAASSGSSPQTYSDPGAAAQAALANAKTPGRYHSAEVRPIPHGSAGLFGPYPVITDCSGFAILCYQAAGWPDPAGEQYNGTGDTANLLSNSTQITNPLPGDLIFFGPGPKPLHVVVYIGNGQAIQMNPGPQLNTDAKAGPAAFIGYWRPKNSIYVSDATVLSPTLQNPLTGNPFL